MGRSRGHLNCTGRGLVHAQPQNCVRSVMDETILWFFPYSQQSTRQARKLSYRTHGRPCFHTIDAIACQRHSTFSGFDVPTILLFVCRQPKQWFEVFWSFRMSTAQHAPPNSGAAIVSRDGSELCAASWASALPNGLLSPPLTPVQVVRKMNGREPRTEPRSGGSACPPDRCRHNYDRFGLLRS